MANVETLHVEPVPEDARMAEVMRTVEEAAAFPQNRTRKAMARVEGKDHEIDLMIEAEVLNIVLRARRMRGIENKPVTPDDIQRIRYVREQILIVTKE